MTLFISIRKRKLKLSMEKNMKIKTTVKSLILSASLFAAFNSNAVNMNDASWYLNVDVESLKQGPLKSVINTDDKEFNEIINVFLGEDFHQQINQVTLYGDNHGFSDFSVIIQGDFTEKSRQDLFNHKNVNLDEEVIYYNNHPIHQLDINKNIQVLGYEEKLTLDDETEIKLYVTELQPNLIMVSRDLSDTQNWLSNKFNISDISQSGLFSVIVNLQQALAHGGMKFDKGNMKMHSEILKKVSQVSFSVIEDKDAYILEAALTTDDEATATQVQQVLNGLIALNALSNVTENALHTQLMSNLDIQRNGFNIIISTSVETDLIVNLIAEKHRHD